MPLVIAYDDVKTSKATRRSGAEAPGGVTTAFIRAPASTERAPTVIHAQYDPGSVSSAHFHTVDQLQIIVAGKGEFGRHNVSPYNVHFSRAYTPYGPLHADKETGWCFMTFRTRSDPGAQRLPGSKDKLKNIGGRTPWQITRKAEIPAQGAGVSSRDIPDIRDERGLFSRALTVAPGMQIDAPDPSSGDGQYVVVVKGSLMHESKEHKAITVVFIKPDEKAFQIVAGAQGLEALILNFPRHQALAADGSRAVATLPGKRQCVLCDFSYDPAVGMPDDGIAAGTRWEDIPETWTCPDCGAGKEDFK